MKEIIDNQIILNPVELCSELAHKRLVEFYKQFNISKSEGEIENIILEGDEDCGLKYTEQAQDMFNQLYDEYWAILENLAL